MIELQRCYIVNLMSLFCMKVRSYEIKIALDDFRSGYSNFSHVLNLPIDFIKIDSSLISNLALVVSIYTYPIKTNPNIKLKNVNNPIPIIDITSLSIVPAILLVLFFILSKE